MKKELIIGMAFSAAILSSCGPTTPQLGKSPINEVFGEATFTFVKYYVQSRHYDELVEENKKLKFELDQEVEWRNRTDN